MGINSLRNRFDRVCETNEKHRKAAEGVSDELKRAVGYEEYGYFNGFGCWVPSFGPPKISVAERLAAIEAYLGIEVVKTESVIKVQKRAKKS